MGRTRLRILLVEDDPLNEEFFAVALEPDGHDLVVERDGVAGQRRALAERFDLILLDVQLPERSGIEVCQNLRAAGLDIPIVALSASVLASEVSRTTAAGFTEFLAKPIRPEALRTAVRAYAGRPSG